MGHLSFLLVESLILSNVDAQGGQWVKTLLTLEPTYLATLCGIAQDKDK